MPECERVSEGERERGTHTHSVSLWFKQTLAVRLGKPTVSAPWDKGVLFLALLFSPFLFCFVFIPSILSLLPFACGKSWTAVTSLKHAKPVSGHANYFCFLLFFCLSALLNFISASFILIARVEREVWLMC